MTSRDTVVRPDRAGKISLRTVVSELSKDPISGFEELGHITAGRITRLNLGPFRPFLVSQPEHVQHVLKDNSGNYVRDGMFWQPLRRLLGNGIMGHGSGWRRSRRTLQPIFTARHVESMMEKLTAAVTRAVDELTPERPPDQPFDAVEAMTHIVLRAVGEVLFGDRISRADLERLAPAIDVAANATTVRLLVPFVPMWMPVPGDRAFRRAVHTISSVMSPLIRVAREEAPVEGDIISTLCHARGEDGRPLSHQQVLDDVIAMFATGTETTAMPLAWFWVMLHEHPDVAERVYAEIDGVVGRGPVRATHVTELRYTRMVLQELLRLYPPGWIVPRQAVHDDTIDGVPVPAGSTVIISPFLTQRMTWLWDSPRTFAPERFDPDAMTRRHRYAYIPFAAGPHQCLGQHFFTAEAQVVVATILSRYRPALLNESPVTPKPAASLRPRQRIDLVLRPRPVA